MSEAGTSKRISHLQYFAHFLRKEAGPTELAGQATGLGAIYFTDNIIPEQNKAAERMLAKMLTPFLSRFSPVPEGASQEAADFIDQRAMKISRRVMDFATITAGEAVVELPLQTHLRQKEHAGAQMGQVTKEFVTGKAAVGASLLLLNTVFGKQYEAVQHFVTDQVKALDASLEKHFGLTLLGKDEQTRNSRAERITELMIMDVAMVAIDWSFRYRSYVSEHPLPTRAEFDAMHSR